MNLFSLPLQIIRNQKEGLKTQKLIEADLKQLITILSPSPYDERPTLEYAHNLL